MSDPSLKQEERYHNMLSNAMHRDKHPRLWAAAAGNSRAIARVQSRYWDGYPDTLEGAVGMELSEALDRLEDGEQVIDSPIDHLQEPLNTGFIQGLARAWAMVSDEPVPDEYIERAVALDR